MLISNSVIKSKLSKYSDKNGKISRSIRNGELKKLKRGLYESGTDVPGYALASSLYGPSYLSFDFALFFYGMIPEKVVVYTSATFGKKKKKSFKTDFGEYTYRDVPEQIYYYGIQLGKVKDYYFQIATKEKALCDKLYTLKPVKNIKEIYNLLVNDLRIDEDILLSLNFDEVEYIASKYHSTNVTMLLKLLRRLSHE